MIARGLSVNRKAKLIGFVLLCLSMTSNASRRHVPMGEYIQYAELIVLADVHKSGLGEIDLTVKEVFKGDEVFTGLNINMKKGSNSLISSGEVRIPKGDNVVILFEPTWEKSEVVLWPVAEIYVEEEIAQLKKIIKLLKIKSEKRRIKKLIKWFPGAEYEIKEQLFVELKNMKARKNFSLFYSAFKVMTTEDDLYNLMRLVEESNDPRAVPFFIEALDSSSKEVHSDAAHALYYSYPGFSGVAEAFEKHWDDEGIRNYTQPYLAARFPDPKYAAVKKTSTPWLDAKAFEAEGNHKAARKIYFDYLQKGKYFSSKMHYAKMLVSNISDDERQLMFDLLIKEAPDFSASSGSDVLELLDLMNQVGWSEEQTAPILLKLLDVEFYDDKVTSNVVLAIGRFGRSVKEKAVAKIAIKLQDKQQDLQPYLILAHLATSLEYAQLMEAFPTYSKTHWMKASALREIKASNDPVKGYIEMIKLIGSSYPPGWPDWLLVHLAAYDDPRVVPALVSFWESHQYYDMNELISGLLVDSKDGRLNQLLLDLLPKATEFWAVYSVTRLIIKRMDEQALPYMRKIIKGTLNGDKGEAMSALGRLGVEDDIYWFKTYCDYDTNVNLKRSRACDALAALRKRHNHDINGPIVKSEKMTPLD